MELYLHAIYLLNLATHEESIRDASVASLVWNMTAAAELGARAVVFHVGSHRGQGFEASLPGIVGALETVLSRIPDRPSLLLESSAGAGDCVGGSFEQLGRIVDALGRPERIGICLDTAHAFAAGYDLRTAGAVGELVDTIERAAGFELLRLVHVNDSQSELGSRRDRHANIGTGHIGLEGFANLLAVPQLRRLPLILETPNLHRRIDEMRSLRDAAETTVAFAA
jgi:deoxyribonuclease-4